MTVIKITDSIMDAVIKMAEGNPGGLKVLMELMKETTGKIDPDVASGFILMLMLDTFNIRGPNIWCLYKDVCDQDLTKTIATIRAVQLGLFPEKKLHEAIEKGEQLNLIEEVQKELPRFAQEEQV